MTWIFQKKFENKLGATLVNDYLNINLYDFVSKNILKINRNFFKMVESYLDLQENETLLDIGSGTSSFSIYLKSENPKFKIHNIDGSKEMIRIAQKKINEEKFDIVLEEALAENIPYKDEYFDKIVAIFLLNSIPQTIKPYALKELNRVLKKGGKLIIVDITKQTGIKKIYDLLKYIPSPFFLEDALNGNYFNLLKEAGFKNMTQTPILDKFVDISLIEAKK